MRKLLGIGLAHVIFLLTFSSMVHAADLNRPATFHHHRSIIGPVSVDAGQALKLCASDVAVTGDVGTASGERRLSERVHQTAAAWSSTSVEVFDSIDLTRPLPLAVPDLVFSQGKGECRTVSGTDIQALTSGSIVVILETISRADAAFNPLATGQLQAPNGTSGTGMLIPAIQSASRSSPKSCCACVPVCGCGACPN